MFSGLRSKADRSRYGFLIEAETVRNLCGHQHADVVVLVQLGDLALELWEKLKAELTSRRVRVVALDLPTSWMMATSNGDEFTGRMFEAINGMLLDMLCRSRAQGLRRPPTPTGAGTGQGEG
jgi:hypothetical protein